MTKEGIDLIKSFEGCRLKAYKCQAGVWTIGYGHTQGVYEGKKITEEEAERLLASDLAKFEMGVRHIVGELSDEKIDALTSFAFNVGLKAFQNSTLCCKVKSDENDASIRAEFSKWVYAGGKRLDGLVRRRKAEANMYFSGVA